MALSTHQGDLFINGTLSARALTLPSSAVTDDKVASGADIAAEKLEHQFVKTDSQKLGVDAASEARVIHVVYGATAEVVSFEAGAVTVAGATTSVTVDLKKNGTTILSAVITLNNTQAAYELVSPSGFASTALVAGDVLTVHYALTGSNEPQGVFCRLVLREKAL